MLLYIFQTVHGKAKKWLHVILMVAISTCPAFAQENSENSITLSGTIICNDSIVGPLPNVNIFNKTENRGTISNQEGFFSLEMERGDTIWFSTVQHEQQFFVYPENEAFLDKKIEIFMLQDTIWLEAVTIYGIETLYKFERELLDLNIHENDVSVAIPVVDKYARQRATGEGKLTISGPLTYLVLKLKSLPLVKPKKIPNK